MLVALLESHSMDRNTSQDDRLPVERNWFCVLPTNLFGLILMKYVRTGKGAAQSWLLLLRLLVTDSL